MATKKMTGAEAAASDDLYRMADGTAATAAECEENDEGVLVNSKTGVPVVLDSDGEPLTLGTETANQKPAEEEEVDKEEVVAAKTEVKPQTKAKDD